MTFSWVLKDCQVSSGQKQDKGHPEGRLRGGHHIRKGSEIQECTACSRSLSDIPRILQVEFQVRLKRCLVKREREDFERLSMEVGLCNGSPKVSAFCDMSNLCFKISAAEISLYQFNTY